MSTTDDLLAYGAASDDGDAAPPAARGVIQIVARQR
jgi:hypothetical protein